MRAVVRIFVVAVSSGTGRRDRKDRKERGERSEEGRMRGDGSGTVVPSFLLPATPLLPPPRHFPNFLLFFTPTPFPPSSLFSHDSRKKTV